MSSGPSSSALDACNVLLVTSTDRLARNTGDLLNILYAVKKVGAGFHSVIEPMVDTTRSLPKLSLPCRGSWLASSAIVSPSAAGSRPRPGRQARSSRGPYPSQKVEALQRLADGDTQHTVAALVGSIRRRYRECIEI